MNMHSRVELSHHDQPDIARSVSWLDVACAWVMALAIVALALLA